MEDPTTFFLWVVFFVLDVWQNGGSCGLGVELIDYGFPPSPSVLSPGGISLLRPLRDGGIPFFSFFFFSFFVQRGRIFIVFSPQEGKGGKRGRGAFFLLLLFATRAHSLSRRIFFCFRAESSAASASLGPQTRQTQKISALLWRTVKAAKREVGESGKELPPLPPSFGTK